MCVGVRVCGCACVWVCVCVITPPHSLFTPHDVCNSGFTATDNIYLKSLQCTRSFENCTTHTSRCLSGLIRYKSTEKKTRCSVCMCIFSKVV